MPPKRPLARKRQSKINFSPSAKISQKHIRAVSLSSDDDDVQASRPSKRRRLEKDSNTGMIAGSPVQPRGRGAVGSLDDNIEISSSSEDGSEGEVHVIPTRKPTKNAKIAEESDEETVSVSGKGKSRAKVGQDKGERASRSGKTRKRRTVTEMSSDSEDILPKQTRRRHAKRSSTPEETRSKKDRRRKAREATPSDVDVDDDDEQEEVDDYDEDNELKEELAFLRSSPLPDRGRLRSTHDKPKSEREKALEALKKRRGAGTEPPSSATPTRKKRLVVDSDEDTELEVIKEVEEVDADVGEDDEIEESDEEDDDGDEASGTNAFAVFQENVEDEDFIDDDDAMIGVPAEHISIPLQFSGLSRAKPRELFKYAVEWMVQKKINPAFAADDEIYNLTFRKLNDEVSGLAQSKFHSSVWTPDFSRALRARPELVVNEIGHQMREVLEPHCEACNRKNHTATWEASLTGAPYNKDTLEPLADDTDSSAEGESDSDSSISSHNSSTDLNGEKATYDATGELLPPESKFFTLGNTCKANTQVAHTLYHWRYHLNSWVIDYLVREGKCTPEKLAKRDKWSVRKRSKYANKIVDKMEREGEIKKLHHLYKDQVDFALEAKNEYARGWGRNKG